MLLMVIRVAGMFAVLEALAPGLARLRAVDVAVRDAFQVRAAGSEDQVARGVGRLDRHGHAVSHRQAPHRHVSRINTRSPTAPGAANGHAASHAAPPKG
jgi:hypothetical protein